MKTERDSISCLSVFSDDMNHRFLWKRVWNDKKPCVCVITLNPCTADNRYLDTTSMLILNNVSSMDDYGGVAVVNLYSYITAKLNSESRLESETMFKTNDEYIIKTVNDAEITVLAWGKAIDNVNSERIRAEDVLKVLYPYREKLYTICDDAGRVGLHPLTPSIRTKWKLEIMFGQRLEPVDP